MISLTKTFKNILGLKDPPDEFVGYEKLLAFIKERALQRLEGDIIEIGAFMGGGTVKLAKFASESRTIVVDVTDPFVSPYRLNSRLQNRHLSIISLSSLARSSVDSGFFATHIARSRSSATLDATCLPQSSSSSPDLAFLDFFLKLGTWTPFGSLFDTKTLIIMK